MLGVHLRARHLRGLLLVFPAYVAAPLVLRDRLVVLPFQPEAQIALLPVAPVVAAGWILLLNQPRAWTLEQRGRRERLVRTGAWVILVLLAALGAALVGIVADRDLAVLTARNAGLYLAGAALCCRLVEAGLAGLLVAGVSMLTVLLGHDPEGTVRWWALPLAEADAVFAAALAGLTLVLAALWDVLTSQD